MSIRCAETTDNQAAIGKDRLLHHDVLRVKTAAIVRVIRQEHIAWPDRLAVTGNRRAHCMTGRAIVKDHRARPMDQIAGSIEQRD